MSTLSATAAPSFEHLEGARAGLRADRRWQRRAADLHEIPKRATSDITGPVTFTHPRGHTCYQYSATVESRPSCDRPMTVQPPGDVLTESG